MSRKFMKNVAWMMWKTMAAVSAIPAIQWSGTQLNWIPRMGKNAVMRRTNIVIAITQWNRREASEWRTTFSGMSLLADSSTSGAVGGFLAR